MNVDTNSDLSFIDCAYPGLDQLILIIAYGISINTEALQGLICKNPQIKIIESFGYFPLGFAKVLESLPNLQNLTLNTLDIGNETLHLESVTIFKLTTSHINSFEHFSLPNLNKLIMCYTKESVNIWNEFFRRHTRLTQLEMVSSSIINGNDDLNQLTYHLTDLVDVEVQTNHYLGNEAIITFFQNNQKLQKFCFSIPTDKFTENIEKTLRERLEIEWIITEYKRYYVGLCFERQRFQS